MADDQPIDPRPFHPRGCGGYADLVLAHKTGGPGQLAAAAALLGYQAVPQRPVAPRGEPEPPPPTEPAPDRVEAPTLERRALDDAVFWQPVARTYVQPLVEDDEPPPETDYRDTRPAAPPPVVPLGRWSALVPRARAAFADRVEGRAPDLDRMIRRLGKGRQLDRLPRLRRRRWGRAVQIVVDRSERLIPYYHDQDLVAARLAALFPRHAIQSAFVTDGLDQPLLDGPDGRFRDYQLPPAGTLVVALSDLGCLAGTPAAAAMWARLGARLVAAGCRPVALLPCPPARWRADAGRAWTRVAWERPATAAPAGPASVAALLRLLALAVRIEPGLLREVRLLLGADAGVEALVWTDPALIDRSSVAATLAPEAIRRLRAEACRTDPPELRAAVVARIKAWRAGIADEVWDDELQNLDPETRAALPAAIRDNDLPLSRRRMIALAETLAHGQHGGAYARRLFERAAPQRFDPADPALRRAHARLNHAAWRDLPDRPPPPPGFDPAHIAADPARERSIDLRQVGDTLVAAETAAPPPTAGSPLATIRTANGVIAVVAAAPIARAAFWASGAPPPWADDWGWDEFGAWVTFSVTPSGLRRAKTAAPVSQRLRWIPPGTFRMGSPETEPGRDDVEGPQHPVTISRGFWLMDTPCTQALWQAVTGKNPSQFKDLLRPVETVSWDDVQGFLNTINRRIPGLDLTLPTEAEWEYACRAGTTSALYTGEIDILGARNAPALDAIAWYGGNSGVDFDLKEGEGSSGWPEKQHAHERAGPRRVGEKQANPWGLFDMLGNVDEWCRDGLRDYRARAETDPTGPLEAGVVRCIRGGSWDGIARFVRAAYRHRFRPGGRSDYLGFRCARVQVVSQAGQGEAEPAAPARVRAAERRTAQVQPSDAVLQLGDGAAADRGPLLPAGTIELRTDREHLHLSRLTCPPWADAIGRDRFGLWFRVALATDGPAPVTQRLRWIPPGRFLMGSPDNEPGRNDWEGPLHPVTISRGFWLMDTPCTQALWQAVMGDNPSRFQSPDRSVEQVSWDQVQTFLARINERVPGLALTLPTEAEWEYACRAGTTTALYTGEIEIIGENNAPALDPIAWYGGNSGVEFDLDHGGSSKTWPDKQYPHERAGTRRVGLKQPNSYGLFDMLGNVWEWCRDGRRTYQDKAEIDPTGPLEAGAERCIRGGSWSSGARLVRAAYRGQVPPGDRGSLLGFRCARVQSWAKQARRERCGDEVPGPPRQASAPGRPRGRTTPRGVMGKRAAVALVSVMPARVSRYDRPTATIGGGVRPASPMGYCGRRSPGVRQRRSNADTVLHHPGPRRRPRGRRAQQLPRQPPHPCDRPVVRPSNPSARGLATLGLPFDRGPARAPTYVWTRCFVGRGDRPARPIGFPRRLRPIAPTAAVRLAAPAPSARGLATSGLPFDRGPARAPTYVWTRCFVATVLGGFWLPGGMRLEHGVEDDEEFPHDSDERNFCGFPLCN